MTNVQFYKVNTDQDRLVLVTRLAAKAVAANMPVFIATQTEQQSSQLSDLLWAVSDTSFLAHEVAHTDESVPDCKMLLSHFSNPGDHHGLLINLQLSSPEWLSRFDMAMEFVYEDEQVITNKRQNYEYFKKRGYPLKYHDMTQLKG